MPAREQPTRELCSARGGFAMQRPTPGTATITVAVPGAGRLRYAAQAPRSALARSGTESELRSEILSPVGAMSAARLLYIADAYVLERAVEDVRTVTR